MSLTTGDKVNFVAIEGDQLPQAVDDATIYFLKSSQQIYLGNTLLGDVTGTQVPLVLIYSVDSNTGNFVCNYTYDYIVSQIQLNRPVFSIIVFEPDQGDVFSELCTQIVLSPSSISSSFRFIAQYDLTLDVTIVHNNLDVISAESIQPYGVTEYLTVIVDIAYEQSTYRLNLEFLDIMKLLGYSPLPSGQMFSSGYGCDVKLKHNPVFASDTKYIYDLYSITSSSTTKEITWMCNLISASKYSFFTLDDQNNLTYSEIPY